MQVEVWERSADGKRDVAIETGTVCLMTDPDNLGPCDPGTSVVLEGVVWSESSNGKCYSSSSS